MLEPDKKPEARRHRFISRQRLGVAAAAMTLAAAALAPASATAGSLLSGYGGPGEGNQAILGSALLGGPSGGGGGGAESGSSATAQGSRGASAGEAATGSSGGKRVHANTRTLAPVSLTWWESAQSALSIFSAHPRKSQGAA